VNLCYEVSREVGQKLAALKYPFPVVYARERTSRANADPVILFMRDRVNGETITAPKGQQGNPRKVLDRYSGVEIRIYACAALDGATRQEHEELADYLTDAVLCALEETATESKLGELEYTEARFMYPEELVTEKGEPEHWPGEVFLLRLKIGRGVFRRDYKRQGRPVGSFTGASGEVEVRRENSDDPEVVPYGAQP
jgi:hypothetical protein